MEHKGTKELRTERLLLRRFTPADAQAMYDNWACDAQVTRFLTWQPHASPAATAALLAGWCESYARPSYYNWTLEYERRPVGNISVVRLDEETSCAELGYCLGRAYWGRGLMAEAASAVIGFLFDEAGVRRVCISHAGGEPGVGAGGAEMRIDLRRNAPAGLSDVGRQAPRPERVRRDARRMGGEKIKT